MFQDHPNLQVQCNIAKRSCLFARHLLRAIAFTSRSCFSILNTSVQICQACNESMNICKVQCCAILCKSHVACHVIVAAWQSTQAEEMSSTGCWIISQEKQHLRSRCKSGVVSWYSCWTLWNSKKNSNDPGITKVIYAIYSTPQCFPPACSHLFLFSQAVTRALKPQGKDKVTKTEKNTPGVRLRKNLGRWLIGSGVTCGDTSGTCATPCARIVICSKRWIAFCHVLVFSQALRALNEAEGLKVKLLW